MALIPTLAPDPGADLAAQTQLLRQQKLAQLLANPPQAPEIDMGGDGGGGGKGDSPEGNSMLAKMLAEDVGRTAGPSVASFDAPVSTGSGSSSAAYTGPGISHFTPHNYKLNDDQRRELAGSIRTTAESLKVAPEHLAAIMSFETGGTLNPWQPGPRTKWGQHHGLIQWGEPQAKQYGVGPGSTISEQVAAAGRYLTDHGVRPGMGLNNLYSAVLHGNAGSGLDVTDANGTSANSGAANMLRTAHINALANLERGLGGQVGSSPSSAPAAPATAPAETPYKVASLGFQPPPRRQPIAPMPPQQPPAPQPAAAPVPPIPTMVGAPLPTTSTPIGATSGATLTDAPMPPSRSASGVDDIIRRQAASARPALTQPEEGDLFDEIGRGLEELFGGFGGGDAGSGGQSQGVQVAGGGEQYYPMQPGTGHGILGLISDAFREPVPIPPEVQALARSPKQSDRLAYQLMVHGNELGGNQSAMMTAMYREAREREQAAENRYTTPQYDQAGNFYQMGPNGEYRMIRAAEKPQGPISVGAGTTLYDPTTRQPVYTAPKEPPAPPASVQEYEYVRDHPEAAGYFNKTRVPDTENTAEIKNFKYAKQNPDFAKSLQRGPSLTAEAIQFYGEQVARGDMSPLQNLGRGAQGAENVTAIRNAAVAFAQANGLDPRGVMDAASTYLGEKAGARTLGTNEANAINAGTEALNALNLGRETNAKLPRGQFYPVNKAIQAYQFGSSDPNLAAYGQAVATIANTYARAVNPKGLPHEAVVSETLRRLNAAQGPAAINEIFNLMQREIEMAQKAPAQAREVLRKNREGGGASGGGSSSSGTTSSGVKWTVE